LKSSFWIEVVIQNIFNSSYNKHVNGISLINCLNTTESSVGQQTVTPENV